MLGSTDEYSSFDAVAIDPVNSKLALGGSTGCAIYVSGGSIIPIIMYSSISTNLIQWGKSFNSPNAISYVNAIEFSKDYSKILAIFDFSDAATFAYLQASDGTMLQQFEISGMS